MATEVPAQNEKISELWGVPVAHLHGGVNLGNTSMIFAEVDAGTIRDHSLVDAIIN